MPMDRAGIHQLAKYYFNPPCPLRIFCKLSRVIWQMTRVRCRFSRVIWRLSRDICHLPRDIWRFPRVIWRLSREIWQMTRDIWQLTHDIWQIPYNRRQMTNVQWPMTNVQCHYIESCPQKLISDRRNPACAYRNLFRTWTLIAKLIDWFLKWWNWVCYVLRRYGEISE